MKKKILIIKLGATGDALRTTVILPALKARYKNCHITWVTDAHSYSILQCNHLIDRLCVLDRSTKQRLKLERFDLLYSFDKAPAAASLAALCKAKEKKGFCMTAQGTLSVFNKESMYALILGISDELKFLQNKKTYPQIIFEMAALPYRKQGYVLDIPEDKDFQKKFLAKHAVKKTDILIGVFTGCGPVFPTKKWSIEGFARLINRLGKCRGMRVVLLGGPLEAARNAKLKKLLTAPVIDSGCGNPLKDFIHIIGLLDVVVAADTLALHLGIAVKKRVVGIFTSTCASEIELYGRGEIVKADIACAPCYKKACSSMKCLISIKPANVLAAIKRQALIAKKSLAK
ncbi:MAG: glycosyltransferase family 9 protein [bacterium]|nr:glycosyltransferase family 9 protein [bacterium]